MQWKHNMMQTINTMFKYWNKRHVVRPEVLFRRKLSGFLLLSLLLILSSVCQADMFEDGLNAFGGQKYEKAYQLWKPLAEKGNSDAQYYMGVMFANGQGVKRNYIVAYAWYSVAAEEQDMAEENRDDIEVTLSEPQLAQAKKLAREYTQKYLPQ